MYRKIDISKIDSEKEFRALVRQKLGDDESNWIIGYLRGRKIVQIFANCGIGLENMVVLDLGCGFGGISLYFSNVAKEVLSLDVDQMLLSITHRRRKIGDKRNVHPILGSALNIPLIDESVDICLIIGVLEWVPFSYPNFSPEHLQLKVLNEVYRILNKKGKLLLAIENRYYLGYWFGRIDHHSGLPFVPILPRRVASFLSHKVKGKPYINWTYSYSGLSKMLGKAGFKIMKTFIGIPSYTLPREIADICNRKEVASKINSARLKRLNMAVWNILNATGLLKQLGSNFILLCSK